MVHFHCNQPNLESIVPCVCSRQTHKGIKKRTLLTMQTVCIIYVSLSVSYVQQKIGKAVYLKIFIHVWCISCSHFNICLFIWVSALVDLFSLLFDINIQAQSGHPHSQRKSSWAQHIPMLVSPALLAHLDGLYSYFSLIPDL